MECLKYKPVRSIFDEVQLVSMKFIENDGLKAKVVTYGACIGPIDIFYCKGEIDQTKVWFVIVIKTYN